MTKGVAKASVLSPIKINAIAPDKERNTKGVAKASVLSPMKINAIAPYKYVQGEGHSGTQVAASQCAPQDTEVQREPTYG